MWYLFAMIVPIVWLGTVTIIYSTTPNLKLRVICINALLGPLTYLIKAKNSDGLLGFTFRVTEG
jgi:hypothetical protein